MSRGGKRPGAGRKKGGTTKATVYRQEMIARAVAEGISPLDVMMTAMRSAWDAGLVNEAVQVAIAAAPYVHPRLAATDMRVDDKRPLRERSTAELEAILAEGDSRGTVAEAEGPNGADRVH